MWGTSDDTRTAYLDSQDVARMALASLRSVLPAKYCSKNCPPECIVNALHRHNPLMESN